MALPLYMINSSKSVLSHLFEKKYHYFEKKNDEVTKHAGFDKKKKL